MRKICSENRDHYKGHPAQDGGHLHWRPDAALVAFDETRFSPQPLDLGDEFPFMAEFEGDAALAVSEE
jgi:hypothetical protein